MHIHMSNLFLLLLLLHMKSGRFSPASDGTVYSASSDGTVSSTDVETGIALSLMNLNPDGWQVITILFLFLPSMNGHQRGVTKLCDGALLKKYK